MANRFTIRHGSGTPTTSNLLPYELGWNGTALYINNNGTIKRIGDGVYLPLAGGTLTGNLTLSKSSTPILSIKNTTMDTAAASMSAPQYNSIFFRDKNDLLNGFLQGYQYTDGKTYMILATRRRNTDDSDNQQNSITLWVADDGTGAVNFTHSLNRYYTASNSIPMISMRANNVDAILFQAGHATAINGAFSNHYKLIYKGTGSSPNNYLQLIANNSSTDTIAIQINENGNVSFTNIVAADISGNAATATSAASATKAIQDGSGNVITSTYLKLTGGTLTDDLTISKAAGGTVRCQNTNKGTEVQLTAGSSAGNHGVWSTGYYDGSTFRSGGKWIIYRNSSNQAVSQLEFTAPKVYHAVWN